MKLDHYASPKTFSAIRLTRLKAEAMLRDSHGLYASTEDVVWAVGESYARQRIETGQTIGGDVGGVGDSFQLVHEAKKFSQSAKNAYSR